MDAPKSLLDKITEDPEFINRGASDATEPVNAKPITTPIDAGTAAAQTALLDKVEPVVLDRDPAFRRVVEPNLLPPRAAAAAGRRHRWPLVVTGLVVLAVAAGVGAWMRWQRQPSPVAVMSPTPTAAATPPATPTPSPTVSVTPSPTPSPTPSSTPTPETVTVPTVTPTVEHPQAVKITSPSGLWLRSSPTSANRGNIIGWMPNGATISVDQIGEFWWHGTYKGRAGYFAVKYTQ